MAGANIMGFGGLLGLHIQGKDSSFFKSALLVMQTVEHIVSSGQ